MSVVGLVSTAAKVVKTASKIMEVAASTNVVGVVGKRLTYELLRNTSYANLIRMGYTPEKIMNKLANFYLKEGRQLIIPKIIKDGKSMFDYKTLAKAVNDLNKGRVRQGKVIDVTMRTQTKMNVRVLKDLTKRLGNDSFANKLYDSYRSGEMNAYQFNKAVHTYANNIGEYEILYEKYKAESDAIIQPIVEGYNA